MGKEKIVWWGVLALFIGFVLLTILGMWALVPVISMNPEIGAFLTGFFLFWLFGNRLIFGYGAVADLCASLLKGDEEKLNKEEIAEKIKKPKEEVQPLSGASVLLLWKGALEPFKYAFYLGFSLIFSLALLFKLNFLISLTFAPIVEAFFLGAAVPTLIVWLLELLSDFYLSDLLKSSQGE